VPSRRCGGVNLLVLDEALADTILTQVAKK
jgi:hypothetical protein